MKKIVVLLLAVLFVGLQPAEAQKKKAGKAKEGYQIEVLLHGAQSGDSLFLQAYEGIGKNEVDITTVGLDGKAVFAKEQLLAVGMYSLNMGGKDEKAIDFFISEGAPQHFKISYALVEGLGSAHFDGSPENEALADYVRFMTQKQLRRQQLQERMQRYMQRPDSAASISAQMEQLFTEVKAKWAEIKQGYNGKLFAMFIANMNDPEPEPFTPPAYPVANLDSLEQDYYYRFVKDHFFDKFDFSSPYILRMPFYRNALSTYFMRVVRPNDPEVEMRADNLIQRSEANDEVYKYTVTQLSQMFKDAPYPELNDIAIHIGERYVVERPEIWKDSAKVAKIADQIAKSKLNPVGSIAADLKLQDPTGNTIALHDVQAPYTVLYFFNPLCHTCAIVTPEVHALYQKYKAKGLQVYAVYDDHKREDWVPYIWDKKMTDWINVWDPDTNSSAGVYDLYDVHAIPTMYILDKDKRVVAKDLYVNTLEMWLTEIMK